LSVTIQPIDTVYLIACEQPFYLL